mmetsp:Transcript_72932/g.206671  ORF Transcript_72932/g.206671 Transcript_72932/m.206671 type:complete len:297 (-) Transcript_72932:483-1373(-)
MRGQELPPGGGGQAQAPVVAGQDPVLVLAHGLALLLLSVDHGALQVEDLVGLLDDARVEHGPHDDEVLARHARGLHEEQARVPVDERAWAPAHVRAVGWGHLPQEVAFRLRDGLHEEATVPALEEELPAHRVGGHPLQALGAAPEGHQDLVRARRGVRAPHLGAEGLELHLQLRPRVRLLEILLEGAPQRRRLLGEGGERPRTRAAPPGCRRVDRRAPLGEAGRGGDAEADQLLDEGGRIDVGARVLDGALRPLGEGHLQRALRQHEAVVCSPDRGRQRRLRRRRGLLRRGGHHRR